MLLLMASTCTAHTRAHITRTHTRRPVVVQGLSPPEYEAQKEAVADGICRRLEKLWPGLCDAIEFREVRVLVAELMLRGGIRACDVNTAQTHLRHRQSSSLPPGAGGHAAHAPALPVT
jgi:hypothetical protein